MKISKHGFTSQTGIRHFGHILPFAGFIQSKQQGRASWLGPMARGSSLKMTKISSICFAHSYANYALHVSDLLELGWQKFKNICISGVVRGGSSGF